ncbi:hypothetical protein ANRL2_03760, partial [Anaerolineae bacterium]
RVLDYARLRYQIELEWGDRQAIDRVVASERLLANDWLKWLQGLPLTDGSSKRLNLETVLVSAPLRGPHSRVPAIERLDKLTGLQSVKDSIKRLKAYMEQEIKRKQAGLQGGASLPSLHLVFKGNPGTGKTTVARIIGEIYRDLELLERGHTVEIENAAALVADYVGGTAIKTNAVIDNALDGVLFIDEAYQLADRERGQFGQEAIDTLLTRMENERHRLAVIVAGYPEKMDRFLESNPGLKGRAPRVIEFPDYTPDELTLILFDMLRDRKLAWTPEMDQLLKLIVQEIFESRDKETFDNARSMRTLSEALAVERGYRCGAQGLPPDELLRPEDVPPDFRKYLPPAIPDEQKVLEELNALVGLKEVKEFVKLLIARLKQEKRQRERGRKIRARTLHMVFAGSPGTGKTTVARLMGKILKSVDILKSGHVVEANRGTLVGSFVGKTEENTRDAIKRAMNGILFIDEAYALATGDERDFGSRAIDELVKGMEDNRDRLVVIAAGYANRME